MNVKKMYEAAQAVFSVVFVAGFVSMCTFSVGSDIYEAVESRNEPVYLIARYHDPIFRTWGFVPDDVMCESPARCEPNGLPSLRYNVLLREHEVREWGLNPSQHRPFVENGQNLDW